MGWMENLKLHFLDKSIQKEELAAAKRVEKLDKKLLVEQNLSTKKKRLAELKATGQYSNINEKRNKERNINAIKNTASAFGKIVGDMAQSHAKMVNQEKSTSKKKLTENGLNYDFAFGGGR